MRQKSKVNKIVNEVKNISRSLPPGTVLTPGGKNYEYIVNLAKQIGGGYSKLVERESLKILVTLVESNYSSTPYKAVVLRADSESNPGTVTQLPITAAVLRRIDQVDDGNNQSENEINRTKVLEVMRYLIKPQIEKFRSEWRARVNKAKKDDLQIFAELTTCPLSNKNLLKVNNIHVDHVVPFSFLAKEFMCLNDIDPYIVKVISGRNKRFENEEYNKRWISYHEENAQLQIVEASANISKSDTIDSTTRAILNKKITDRYKRR